MTVGRVYGGVAQLARAFGSYPKCHRFESSRRYQLDGRRPSADRSLGRRLNDGPLGPYGPSPWRVGQAAKTPPFHGGNTGSIPVRVTMTGGIAPVNPEA